MDADERHQYMEEMDMECTAPASDNPRPVNHEHAHDGSDFYLLVPEIHSGSGYEKHGIMMLTILRSLDGMNTAFGSKIHL